jgi:hypothetical protein
MKKLIKKLLRENLDIINEIMTPTEGNEPHENGNANYIAIAQDDETDEFLVLWVELHKEDNNEHTYSYFFNLVDNEGNFSDRFYTREETDKYLPQEIKSSIIPLVKSMTTNLVNRIQPNIINRNAIEFLTLKGMERYDIISKLLQDEMGYKLIWQGKNPEGKQSWKFQKDGIETEMNEDTISEYYIPKPSTWLYDKEGHKRQFESMREVFFENMRIDKEKRLLRENNK